MKQISIQCWFRNSKLNCKCVYIFYVLCLVTQSCLTLGWDASTACIPEMNLFHFPGSSVGEESACSIGDPGSVPGLGRSPGEGTGYPLQNSGLENSMDCIVHGVTKSWTQLSDFHTQLHVCLVRTENYGTLEPALFSKQAVTKI